MGILPRICIFTPSSLPSLFLAVAVAVVAGSAAGHPAPPSEGRRQERDGDGKGGDQRKAKGGQ